MRNQLNQALFLTFFGILLIGCSKNQPKKDVIPVVWQQLTDSIRQYYTPDQRVDRFKPDLSLDSNGCLLLRGAISNKKAAKALLATFSKRDICTIDSLRYLPVAALGSDTFGIINVSVANFRTQPKHSGELTTQVLLGMPIKVVDQQGDWFMVQTPEHYYAWLEAGAFVRKNYAEMRQYYSQPLGIFAPNTGVIMDQPNSNNRLSDLTAGNLLVLGKKQGIHQQILLPDGRKGSLAIKDIRPITDVFKSSTSLEIARISHRFYGIPYLWGGTSAKGMDCSGFTKMTYLMNGYVIPRDASQQVHAGTEVPLDEQLTQLMAGDLLFFGNLREDGSQRITHVGIYLGNGRFVHSGADNGFIREQSLFADAEDFAPHRKESLLRAKRLEKGAKGVVNLMDVLAPFQ